MIEQFLFTHRWDPHKYDHSGQSWPGINGIEGIICVPQSFRTGASPSDGLVSCPADWTRLKVDFIGNKIKNYENSCVYIYEWVCMCVCVQMCACICICVWMLIYVYDYIYVCIYIYIYVYECAYTYMRVCMCMYLYMCVYQQIRPTKQKWKLQKHTRIFKKWHKCVCTKSKTSGGSRMQKKHNL